MLTILAHNFGTDPGTECVTANHDGTDGFLRAHKGTLFVEGAEGVVLGSRIPGGSNFDVMIRRTGPKQGIQLNAKIGFYGATPIEKQTVPPNDVEALRLALVNQGLIS